MADARADSVARHPVRRYAAPALVALLVAGVAGAVALASGVVVLGGRPDASAPVAMASSPSPVATPQAAATPPLPATPGPTATPRPTAGPAPSAAPRPTQEPDCQTTARVPLPTRLDAPTATLLQAVLDKTRATYGVPGVSVAIVWDSGYVWTGTSGSADVAAKTPVTSATAFSLASISKTFTATVILELVAEGRLTLEQPAADLLPEFGLDPLITVRMLLDHTSGLPDFFTTEKADEALAKSDELWTAARAWSFVPKSHRVPGSAYIYSNTNYVLLGEIIRKVTGHAPAVEIRRRLLEPLHLAHTWYQEDEAPLAAVPAGYMLRWFSGKPRAFEVAKPGPVVPFRSVVTASGAAGSMAGTALDTARWMAALMGGHVLPPDMLQAMLDDQANVLALGSPASYGLGMSTVNMAGYPGLGHSGRFLGVRNVVRYIPALGLSIAILTNQREIDPAAFGAPLVKTIVARSPVTRAASLPVCSPTGGWKR